MNNLRLGAVLTLILILAGCQPASPKVTLALLGDLILGRGMDPGPNSLSVLAPDLAASDLVLANLESPLSTTPPQTPSTYNLCTSSSRAALLAGWGFDLLSVANNHQDDCSPSGAQATRAALLTAGITPLGPGPQAVHRLVRGLPLAFLAFDDISSPLDEASAIQAIHAEHTTGALVIVSIHWGMEYQGGASVRQKSLAEQFVNAGAVLVWGHHPHVLQPAAWLQNPNGQALILYSLGNALFDQPGLEDTRQSALVLVTITAHGVSAARAVPFEIDVAGSQLVRPDPGAASAILARLKLP